MSAVNLANSSISRRAGFETRRPRSSVLPAISPAMNAPR